MTHLRNLSLRAGVSIAFAIAQASTALAGGIRIVDNPTLPPFATLQAAVDAAPEGALLLMQGGNYGGAVIDNKSITLMGMPFVPPRLTTTLTVKNLAAGKRVVLGKLEVSVVTGPAIVLRDNVGSVSFQHCPIRGGSVHPSSWGSDGEPGIVTQNSSRLVFASCQILGGDAVIYAGTPGLPGGPAMQSLDSNMVLYDCYVRGGRGGHEGAPGGLGGDAIQLTNFGLFAAGTTIWGGSGGGADYIGCPFGGNGGDALEANNAIVRLLDSPLVGGSGGGGFCLGTDGSPGLTLINNGSVVNPIAGTRRKLEVTPPTSPVRVDNLPFTITVTGPAGDRFYLMRSWSTNFAWQSAWHGVWTIPTNGSAVARAVIPPSGVLTMQIQPSAIVGLEQRLELLQGFCIDASGQSWLTGPIHIAFLDAVSGPDCDGNGVNDFFQLVGFGSDCNFNAWLDACDISSGTSQDSNGNGIPDECPGG